MERTQQLGRRTVLAGAGAALAAPTFAQTPPLFLTGRYVQGGYAIGRTDPRAVIRLDGEPVTVASQAGWFVIGFDRDALPTALLDVRTPQGSALQSMTASPADYDIQRIDGLPQDTVTPSDPALLARIKDEVQRKAAGFASRTDDDAFRTGFAMPLQPTRISGRWGGQRILNGEPRPPHMGVDLAAPEGTPIFAPAGGIVCFADPDMHFEGGLVMIDHGQGLVSLYLHQSRVDVAAGQRLAQGDLVGAVGMKGRATGPHLCWRMRWRGRHMNPLLMVGAGSA